MACGSWVWPVAVTARDITNKIKLSEVTLSFNDYPSPLLPALKRGPSSILIPSILIPTKFHQNPTQEIRFDGWGKN